MYPFSDLINYIMFLKKQCGLLVSLHRLPENNRHIVAEKLRAFNFHETPYCAFVKRNPQANKHCVECQRKVTKRCEGGVFNGVCYAGVCERVYPINNGTNVIGFISVSGYQIDNADSYFQRLSHIYGFDAAELKKRYAMLNPVFPDTDQLDTLLLPLCQMLELAYIKSDTQAHSESLPDQVIQFIKEHHNQHITSEEICQQFYCSRSFMSTQFNKTTGKSIREYINELRVADAKRLLSESALSVTEIAFLVGFNSSNHFSDIFKKQVGISPLKYRKSSRK